MLSFDQIKELVELVAQRGLGGLELERSGFRLRIEGQPAVPCPAGSAEAVAPAVPAAAAPPPTAVGPAGPPAAAPEPGLPPGTHILYSPIVGTFYRSAAPEAPPFVHVGSRVTKGQVPLCIIEAMKLMNEIESDVDGEILQIFPQNAQAVEFGEPLFAIRPS